MGYTKIVQFGDLVEIYEYQNKLNRKEKTPSKLQAERLANPTASNGSYATLDVRKKRQKLALLHAKQSRTYERSKRSIRRSQMAFFRLVHHNNCLAKTIHFLTITFAYDVTYPEASRHVRRFMEKIKRARPDLSLSYISVPELTKKGRFHFHLLVYGLPPETQKTERNTRNFQRLFQRGFIDLVFAYDASEKIAGYMAKYMAKSFSDSRYETVRGYNASRNIAKITSHGSNSLAEYTDLILSDVFDDLETKVYHVPYLGACQYKKIKIK